MTKTTKTSLVAIQALIASSTFLMFGAGIFGITATGIIEDQREPFDLVFEKKMRPLIGKPYTEERHYKLLELMRLEDKTHTSSDQSLRGASEIMRDVGGILCLGSLASVFMLLRKARSKPDEKQSEA